MWLNYIVFNVFWMHDDVFEIRDGGRPVASNFEQFAKEFRQQNNTVPQRIVDALRRAILNGLLRPGEPLHTADLAESFGVSRMPIREALLRLSNEGLVQYSPRKGATVAQLSKENVIEIYELRCELEALAIRHAVPNLSASRVSLLRELVEAMERCTDLAEWVALNRRFHTTIYEAAERPYLLGLIEKLRNNVERYMRLYLSLADRSALEDNSDHRRIAAAIERGDVETAEAATRRHIERTSEMLVQFLEKTKEEGNEA